MNNQQLTDPHQSEEVLRNKLETVFKIQAYLPGQKEVVTRLVAGKSVLAIFPTGGGKSLCYQLPALIWDGLTVVISPLIALMKDQIDFLNRHEVPAARLDSSLSREETLQLYDDLHTGKLKLLYISPERLSNERFLQTLRRQPIALLAIDEVHCISEWGHNFRPDYLKLASLAKDMGVARVLGLTATATPEVAQDIASAFGIAKTDIVHTGFYRPNLKLRVTPCRANERDNLLLSRLRTQPPGPTIIYVTLQHTAEDLAEFLTHHGLDAQAYHAGMETNQRNAVQDSFMASNHSIIVATIAFGMGIDKRNIRYIYHYNLPKSLENYSQEIGRAGRDGEVSHCELLACPDDVTTLENFVYGDTPGYESVTSLVREILSQGAEFSVSVYELSGNHDMRPLVVKTLLTYLELLGVIQSTRAFYTGYKFQPQRSSAEILGRVDEARAVFLRKVFRNARKGKTWFSLDVDAVSQAIAEPRERIVAALTYLDEVGDLVLQTTGAQQGYRLVKMPEDRDRLSKELCQRFLKREQADIARIQSVMNYTYQQGCLTKYLLSYFGEERDCCGHCAYCEGHTVEAVPACPDRVGKRVPVEQIERLRTDGKGALDSPRQLARFLCGISSPATSRAKLRSHELFGVLETMPFQEVLTALE